MKQKDKLMRASNGTADSTGRGSSPSRNSLADRVRGLRDKHGRPPGWPFPAPRVRKPDQDRSPPDLETDS